MPPLEALYEDYHPTALNLLYWCSVTSGFARQTGTKGASVHPVQTGFLEARSGVCVFRVPSIATKTKALRCSCAIANYNDRAFLVHSVMTHVLNVCMLLSKDECLFGTC